MQSPGAYETDIAPLLARYLQTGKAADLDRFIKFAQPVVAVGVWRAAKRMSHPDRAFIDDMIQETFLKICADDFRVLRDFRACNTNALEVYLKTIAASVVIDHFRSQSAQKKGSGKKSASLDDVADGLAIEDTQFSQLERSQMLLWVGKCLDTQEPRNRAIFWLYHRQELKPRVISALPGINLSSDGVETLIYRLTRAVRDCLRRAGLLRSAPVREGGFA